MQWAIGDWFNAIPERWSDKKAACEEVGLNFQTATLYGWVADKYKFSERFKILKFDHHLKVANLPEEQRTSLLRRAEWGEEKDGQRKPWHP